MSRKNTNQPEYGTELKLAAVRRVLAGESVSAVAQELGIRGKRLYVWKDRHAELGEVGLAHGRGGRPRKVASADKNGPDAMSGHGELLAARRRIAELERKVGQQELELDFFGEALQRIKVGGNRARFYRHWESSAAHEPDRDKRGRKPEQNADWNGHSLLGGSVMKARSARQATSLTFLLLASLASAQLPGSITGTVKDEGGSPVVHAQVRVDPLDGRPTVGDVRIVATDQDGHFMMNNLGLISYKIFAVKEPAGYPNTAFGFYSNHMFPTVTLTADRPTADITLKVGPPAGVILGSVTDAVTGAPVLASFLLRRISDPGNWISMSQKADYRVLVPPSVEVSVEVSAPGYKTWYYGGPSDALGRPPVRLETRKEMKLDIQLQPEDKSEKQP